MKKLILRRQSGSSKNGWVLCLDTNTFVNPERILYTAKHSGNQTLEWELKPGKYRYQEIWYRTKTRKTLTVTE